MQKQKNDFFKNTTKGMFFDYTQDICKTFMERKLTEITIRELMDFIDIWVEKHFKDYEDEDATS